MCVGVEVISLSLSLSLSQVNDRVHSYPRRPAMSNNGIFQLIMKCRRTRGLIIIKYLCVKSNYTFISDLILNFVLYLCYICM